jgi:hypothetical protein
MVEATVIVEGAMVTSILESIQIINYKFVQINRSQL